MVTLPLLLGFAVFAPISAAFVAAALGVGMIFAGLDDARPLRRDAGYALALGALLVTRQPVGAFMLAVIWAPLLLLRPARGARLWAVAALMCVAFAFAQ
jgi:hypothetical protein